MNIGKDVHGVELLCDANLFGRYAQDLSETTGNGVASMVAFNTSARYADRSLLGRRDSYYFAHVGGPALKLWAVHGDFVARFDGTAHFDAGAVRSLAWPEYLARFGDSGAATVLKMHEYYFGVGGSVAARGSLSYKALELGGRLFLGRYGSVDRGDRFPDEVPRAIHTSDHVTEIEGWAGVAPRTLPFQVRAFYEYLPRSSTMSSVTTTRWDQRFGITLGLNL
jgi:hypothetical protein